MSLEAVPSHAHVPRPAAPASARTRRQLVLGLAASLAVPVLPACSPRGPVRIGFIGGMSGRVADLGIGGRNGAQLAVDAINASGGLEGRPVELLIRDDEQDNDKARTRFLELVKAEVAFVVGPMTSSIAVALAPLAAEHGMPLVSPTSTTHELSGKVDAFFRVVPDAPSGARQQARLLAARGLKRLVSVVDTNNRAFSESWAQGARAGFQEHGGLVAASVEFKSAQNISYVDLARQVAAAQPDVALFAASASDTSLLCQQVRRLDAKVAFATSPWAGTEQFIQMGGRAIEGAVVAHYFDRDGAQPGYRQFVEQYQKRFGEPPGFPSTTGHDAVSVGLQALRERGSGTLLASLRQARSYAGLQHPIMIDANGDSKSPIFMTEVRDGRYVSLPGA